MIAASARLLLPTQIPLGQGGTATCGIWSLQVANTCPTANTVSAPPTPRSSAMGPWMPLLGREQHLLHDPASQGFAGNGTSHGVCFLLVNTSMPV